MIILRFNSLGYQIFLDEEDVTDRCSSVELLVNKRAFVHVYAEPLTKSNEDTVRKQLYIGTYRVEIGSCCQKEGQV
jgi:hypothetical protein